MKIKDPEAADLTSHIVDTLDSGEADINGRNYVVLACHDTSDYQTVFLELADITHDDLGPKETIEYTIRITKKRKNPSRS